MMFSPDALESEIRVVMNRMDAILTIANRSDKSEYSLQERQLMTLQWKALDQYKTILEMHLDMLENMK